MRENFLFFYFQLLRHVLNNQLVESYLWPKKNKYETYYYKKKAKTTIIPFCLFDIFYSTNQLILFLQVNYGM